MKHPLDNAPEPTTGHAYPDDLATLVAARWAQVEAGPTERPAREGERLEMPLAASALARVLSVCYQVSLLREEARPITFRLAVGGAEAFAATSGPPAGLHRVILTRPRPFDEHELRRLAPAAPFHRSIIGAGLEHDEDLRIWGLIHSGPHWQQSVRGGRGIEQAIPLILMIAVMGPGRLLVSKGARTVAALSAGTLASDAMDVFRAPWLSHVFHEIVDAQSRAHAGERALATVPWERLEGSFGALLAEHALRRILSTIRAARHGGTLLLVPAAEARQILREPGHLALKYAFRDEEPRRRILTLTVRIMDRLANLHGPSSLGAPIGWSDYEVSSDTILAALDEALFEAAHLVASLADVDGAVLMTNELELLGFGGEICGALPEVPIVAHALDPEGSRREWVETDRFGTRHRSVFRLCQAVRRAIAIVVSQDGGLSFVRWHDGHVTFWTQIATGPWEV